MNEKNKELFSKSINVLKGFGFFILYLFLTLLVAGILVYLFISVWKQNNFVAAGVPYLLIGYFWGIFYLGKHGFRKFVGIVFFTLAVLMNLLLIAIPYNAQTEFISTRFFILTALGSGIYLIFRRSVTSRIFGILILIISILAALLGSVFMSTKL